MHKFMQIFQAKANIIRRKMRKQRLRNRHGGSPREFAEFVHEGFVLFATYFPSEMPASNPLKSHSHACFHYTVREISALAQRVGFKFENIGDWGHPRGQHVAAFRKL